MMVKRRLTIERTALVKMDVRCAFYSARQLVASHGLKVETLLKWKSKTIQEWKSMQLWYEQLPMEEVNPSNFPFMPLLAEYVLLDAIECFGFQHIVRNMEGNLCAAELAVYLGCPLIANSTQFFIFCSEYEEQLQYIPWFSISAQTKQLKTQCVDCRNSNKNCQALECLKYCQENSPLSVIDSKFLPFLNILAPNQRLQHIFDTTTATRCQPSLSSKKQRIHDAIFWLKQFHGAPLEYPLHAVLSRLDKSALTETGTRILKVMLGYVMDPEGSGRKTAEFLSLAAVPRSTRSVSGKLRDIYKNAFRSVLTSLHAPKSVIESIVEPDPTGDMIRNWPIGLVNRFRQSRLPNYALYAVYILGGVVVSMSYEDSTLSNAAGKVSQPLRQIQYNLLLGLESQSGSIESKCHGWLDGHVTEYLRAGDQFESCRVSCKPHYLTTAYDSVERFMVQQFGDVRLTNAFDRQMYRILRYWFKHSEIMREKCDRFDQCSLALAFSGYAYALRSGSESMKEKILSHNHQMIASFKQFCFQDEQQPKAFCTRIVHGLSELQFIVLEMEAIYQLVRALLSSGVCIHEASVNQFGRFWRIFGSCRVIYWLTLALDLIPKDKRMAQMNEQWLKQMTISKTNACDDNTVRELSNKFKQLWSTLVS